MRIPQRIGSAANPSAQPDGNRKQRGCRRLASRAFYGISIMSSQNIGNSLYRLTSLARDQLFNQGELAQLTYGALDAVANNIPTIESDVIEVHFPVGYRPDRTSILSTRKYAKAEFWGRYQYLALHQLPLNCLVQLVTIVEALLGDVLRTVITCYPHKLGAKRTIPLQVVLEAKSIEDIHLRAMDSLLNELSYKSPHEFAESLRSLLSINLLECTAFHKYVEIKATRDIFIHNRGIVNDTYLRKAGSHARAKTGLLPVDIPYFLESYECCLQLTEWLENELHTHWYSSELEDFRNRSLQTPEPPQEPTLPIAPMPTLEPSATPKPTARQRRKRSVRKERDIEHSS